MDLKGGWLQVWYGFFSRWSKQYFRLGEETLEFGPTEQDCSKKIHLKVAQIVTTVDDPISFIIYTGTQTLRIRANSIEERVRWFKKIKAIQRKLEKHNYEKKWSGYEMDKNNKLKVLNQLTLDLWKFHAELQNIIEDINRSVKGSSLKPLTDKLRITVQTIKVKHSEALKIIEDQTLEITKQRNYNHVNYPSNDQYEVSSAYSDAASIVQNDTRYLSFDEMNIEQNGRVSNKKQQSIFKKKSFMDPFVDTNGSNLYRKSSNKHSNYENESMRKDRGNPYHANVTKYQSFDNMNPMDSSEVQMYPMSRMSKKQSIQIQNAIKARLLASNPVFKKLKPSITNAAVRDVLPQRFTPQQKFPLFSILLGAGSDITKFSFPVTVNEPISFLQKGCEAMYYSSLLDEADKHGDPEQRMLKVAAFVVSQYSLSDNRTKKPFNPLLGETFEYIDEERQFYYLSEQVSHHPPISAIHCRSEHFELLDNSKNKTSFTGTSLKFIPEAKGRITLQKFKEEYVFNKCLTTLNGLVAGKMTIQVSGDIVISCKKFNTRAILKFKEQTFWKKQSALNGVEGEVLRNDEVKFVLKGKWNKQLRAYQAHDQRSFQNLWERRHGNNPNYYNFNDYTMQLNHLNWSIFETVAPTDSRLRPDQRALELRDIDLASSEKNRLEQKQRAVRKQNEETRRFHQVRWFSQQISEEGDQYFLSTEEYWEERRKQSQWANCLDIF